ncbi:MAG: type IV pilus modification PilV family protein [Terriglobales bacterium]
MSLLEVIIALALLATGVTAIAYTFSSTIRADTFNSSTDVARYLAQKQIEEMLARYNLMSTPCVSGSCGTFTDSDGQTDALNDNNPQILNSSGELDFSTAQETGYNKTVLWPPSTGVPYDIRWNVVTAGGIHSVTVGVHPLTGNGSGNVSLHSLTP